jgi:glycine cleavage system regulatory protein
MKNYLLLTALDTTGMTHEELIEALEEFGCKMIESKDNMGEITYYATCRDLQALASMSFELMLPGNIIEYTAIYDSKEEETITEIS